jgi:hypothetical protein
MFKYYIVVLIFGQVAAVTGPIKDHGSCKNQAEARYGQIVSTAKAKNITSIVIEGKTATQKDLRVICKAGLFSPRIVLDLTNISQ